MEHLADTFERTQALIYLVLYGGPALTRDQIIQAAMNHPSIDHLTPHEARKLFPVEHTLRSMLHAGRVRLQDGRFELIPSEEKETPEIRPEVPSSPVREPVSTIEQPAEVTRSPDSPGVPGRPETTVGATTETTPAVPTTGESVETASGLPFSSPADLPPTVPPESNKRPGRRSRK